MSKPREDTAPPSATAALMARRFRGYLPVAIDVETGGFHPATDALLEIAAVLVDMAQGGRLKRGATPDFHAQPLAGARIEERQSTRLNSRYRHQSSSVLCLQ